MYYRFNYTIYTEVALPVISLVVQDIAVNVANQYEGLL